MKNWKSRLAELLIHASTGCPAGYYGKNGRAGNTESVHRGNEHVYQYCAVFVLQSAAGTMALTYARSTALTEVDRGAGRISKELRFRLDPENTAQPDNTQGVWYGRSILGGKWKATRCCIRPFWQIWWAVRWNSPSMRLLILRHWLLWRWRRGYGGNAGMQRRITCGTVVGATMLLSGAGEKNQ